MDRWYWARTTENKGSIPKTRKAAMNPRNFESVNLFVCVSIVSFVLCFSMAMTHGGAGGSRSGSGLGSDIKPIKEGLRGFIASEITRDIL